MNKDKTTNHATVFYADKKKVWKLTVYGVLMLTGFAYILLNFDSVMQSSALPRWFAGGFTWFGLLFFGLCMCRVSMFLTGRRPVAVIDGDGIVYYQMWRQSVAWRDVEKIQPYSFRTNGHTDKGALVFLKDNAAFIAQYNFAQRLLLKGNMKLTGTPFLLNTVIIKGDQQALLTALKSGLRDYRARQKMLENVQTADGEAV